MKVKVAQLCPTLCDPHGLNSPGQNTGVGKDPLLQGIFPTQGSKPGLPHCRRILYQLIHKGSPRILEWVAYPFSSGSSQPRNQTGVSCIAADSLPTELSGKLLIVYDVEHLMCLFAIYIYLYIILSEISLQVICWFPDWFLCLSVLHFKYSRYDSLVRYMIWEYILQSLFHLLIFLTRYFPNLRKINFKNFYSSIYVCNTLQFCWTQL